jgi:hypothetical protein
MADQGAERAIGLFSIHTNEGHKDLLDCSKLEIVGNQAGLALVW